MFARSHYVAVCAALSLGLASLVCIAPAVAQRHQDERRETRRNELGLRVAVQPDPQPADGPTTPAPEEPAPVPAAPPAEEPVTEPAVAEEEEPSSASDPVDDAEVREETAEATSREAGGDELTFYGTITGELQLRATGLDDIPLPLLAGTRGDLGAHELDQNYLLESWLRVRAELGIRTKLKLVGQLDLVEGLVAGDLTRGVSAAERPRDDYDAFPGVRPRWLFLEWQSPIGLVRAGQMGSHWGLGILANDGEHTPVFGDYHGGDIVERLAFATKPFGRDTGFVVALAGDLVYSDVTADLRDDDRAWQGVLAAYYERPAPEGAAPTYPLRRLGFYGVYRDQVNELDDYLRVFVMDAFASWHWPDPTGGRLFAAIEAVAVVGKTTITRTVNDVEQDVEQLMLSAQIGRHHDNLDIVLEAGYASGDSNNEDATQRRATFDHNHRVGLVLFPEVLAWQTARAATLASAPELFGRPARGSELVPTNGGVSGAMYLFPHVIWRPRTWIELRGGALLARASADIVNPFTQRAESRSVNYRGGDSTRRDLGLELDGSVILKTELHQGVTLSGGLEAGILFPGRGFEDAMGVGMDEVGLARLRLGLGW